MHGNEPGGNERRCLKKALVVDDDPDSCDLLKTIMKPYGLLCVAASNGEEGLILYCRDHYDLVVTNINMPVMNGIELVYLIRAMCPKQPIIVASAGGGDHFPALQRNYPNRLRTILQPFKVEDFRACLTELIGHPTKIN